jgi:hypothetical protein
MTEPTDEIPEFILEKLHSYDADTLGVITEHLLGRSTGTDRDLPEDLKPVLVMQDESTLEAIGETADRMSGPDDEPELSGYEGMAQDIIEYVGGELGEDVALSAAQDIEPIELDQDGHVAEIDGSKQLVVEQLADAYLQYAGPAMKNSLSDIAGQYDVEAPVNLSMNPFE